MQQNEKNIDDDLADSFYKELESILEEANQEIQDIKPDKEIENINFGNQPAVSGIETENDEDDNDEDDEDDYSNKGSSEEGGCLKSCFKIVFLLLIVGVIINSVFSHDVKEEKAKPTSTSTHVNQTSNNNANTRNQVPDTKEKSQDTKEKSQDQKKKTQPASKPQDIEFRGGTYGLVDHIGSERGNFFLVELTVANISNETVSVNRSGFALYDTKGRKYSCSNRGMSQLFYLREPYYHLVTLQPGEVFTGKIVFEVPENFEFSKLSVEPHMFKKGFEIFPSSK